MSIENGAGLRRSNRTRVPLAVVVNCSAPLPPLTSTVSMSVAAFVEVGVVAGVPDHPVVAALPEGLVVGVAAGEGVVLAAAEQQVEATLAEQRVVAGLAEELVVAGAAGEHVVAGAAEQVGPRQRAVDLAERDHVLPPWPKTWISAVLATVGVPPATVTAPPLTRICPPHRG